MAFRDGTLGLDHSLLSPCGKMSKRALDAAKKRAELDIFGPEGAAAFFEGIRIKTAQPADKEYLLRKAAEFRDLASRGIGPRKHMREAVRLESLAAAL